MKNKTSFLPNLNNTVFEKKRANTKSVMDAKKVLPRTIISGLQDRNFPKRPATPNRKTAIWICTSPLFNIDVFKFK